MNRNTRTLLAIFADVTIVTALAILADVTIVTALAILAVDLWHDLSDLALWQTIALAGLAWYVVADLISLAKGDDA